MQAKLLRIFTPAQDLLDIANAGPGAVTPVSAEGMDVTVYTIPTSICAQRVRMTLVEKGIAYTDYTINTREMENLQPWYLAMNPRGLVPTLKFGDRVIFDSETIMKFIDAYFIGPRLSPQDPQALSAMRQWLSRQDKFPVRDLSYRWQLAREAQGQMNYWRKGMFENLLKAKDRYPENSELFDLKLREWADIEKCVSDPIHMAKADETVQQFADDVDSALAQGDYLCGDEFTLADIGALALLVRVHCGCGLNLWGEGLRPRVEQYVERLKLRDSYRIGVLEPYDKSEGFALEGDCWYPQAA